MNIQKFSFFFFVIIITFFAFINCSGNQPETSRSRDEVSVNYRMAEEALQWLEYIKTEPGMENIQKHFMKEVAPTKGCRSIVHHWQRFREWNEKIFLDFILEALDGEIGQKEIFETWLTGLQGPVYVLGSDMFAVIEKHLGLEEAKKAAQDYRLFLSIYNRAAEKARAAGEKAFLFDETFAANLEDFTGAAGSSDQIFSRRPL